MKISKEYLRKIIEEEFHREADESELDEAAWWDALKAGVKKGAKAAYSAGRKKYAKELDVDYDPESATNPVARATGKALGHGLKTGLSAAKGAFTKAYDTSKRSEYEKGSAERSQEYANLKKAKKSLMPGIRTLMDAAKKLESIPNMQDHAEKLIGLATELRSEFQEIKKAFETSKRRNKFEPKYLPERKK
jgi:hypothetical protein